MLYWSTIEWAYYVQAPPFGADSMGYDWAAPTGYPQGFVAWYYGLPTLAIAYLLRAQSAAAEIQ